MIPVCLRIKGFLSYREQATLSFTEFDLACISGANGAGKSSLLDAVTWALFGKARRSDDALINNASDAAEVALDFDYESDRYRVQRIKARDRNTVLEFKIYSREESWKTLTESTLKETQQRIQETLRMDYKTFINASFFLQGKADEFTQKNSSERKEILTNILGLNIWERYRDLAREKRHMLEKEIATLQGWLQEIENELDEEESRKTRLAELEQNLERLKVQRKMVQANFEQASKLVQSVREQEKLNNILRTHVESLRKKLADVTEWLETRYKEQKADQLRINNADLIEKSYRKWLALREDLQHWDEKSSRYHLLVQNRASLEQEIAVAGGKLEQELKNLQVKQKENVRLQGTLPALQRSYQKAQREIGLIQARVNERAELEFELQSTHEEGAHLSAENQRLKQQMDELKNRIGQLNKKGVSECPLCGQPLAGVKRTKLVAELETRGKSLGDAFHDKKREIDRLEKRKKEIADELKVIWDTEKQLHELQRQADLMQNKVDLAEESVQKWREVDKPNMLEMESKLKEGVFARVTREKLMKIDQAIMDLGYDPAVHESMRKEEQRAQTTEEQFRMLETARGRLETIEREIDDLKKQKKNLAAEFKEQETSLKQAGERLAKDSIGLPNLEEIERNLNVVQEEENRLRVEVGGAQQLVSVLETQRRRKKKLTAKREELAKKVSRLKMLEKSFGKDGVPALLIEQALPEIEVQANEILDRLSSGSMSVRFETQRAYKEKKREDKKQVLDILISDAVGVRPYEMFSGGEAFRINFAIRLALSRILAQRAGARLQTLVVDEGFGSQDAEGRQRLIEAINMVRPNFAKILVITHLEELKDAFPARVEVEKTPQGSRVQVMSA